MTIDSKYNIGDSHFVLQDNKVSEKKINAILVEEEVLDYGASSIKRVAYRLNTGQFISEDKIITSKEELLKSL